MPPEDEEEEQQQLRAALRHLQADAGVLERLVYKYRNQHRGAAYFKYLLKVRRDLKLLHAANLVEVTNAVFPVIAGRRPASTVLHPVRQGKRKPGANHGYHGRLLGVARLLSQMVEPVMKAAVQTTLLLAKSFFVEFCTAVLALLARVRVLIQQILLDVVSVYNKVTNLIDKKQDVKISIDGVQAFREYYPSSGNARITLECIWVKDKFVLHERTHNSCEKGHDLDEKSFAPEASIQYETLGLISEAHCLENTLVSQTVNLVGESDSQAKQSDAALEDQPNKISHGSASGGSENWKNLGNENIPNSGSDTVHTTSVKSTPRNGVSELKPDTRKSAAYVAVGNSKSMPSETRSAVAVPHKKQRVDMIFHTPPEPEDVFGNLLGSDSTDKSIF